MNKIAHFARSELGNIRSAVTMVQVIRSLGELSWNMGLLLLTIVCIVVMILIVVLSPLIRIMQRISEWREALSLIAVYTLVLLLALLFSPVIIVVLAVAQIVHWCKYGKNDDNGINAWLDYY